MSKWLNYFSPNVSHLHGHKRLDDDASLLPQESDGVVFWMRKGAVLLKHTKKLILGQPAQCAYVAVASEQEGCRDSTPLHFDTKSEQSDCNKSSVGNKVV